MNQTFKFLQSRGTHSDEMPFTNLLQLLREVARDAWLCSSSHLAPLGKNSHHTEDDKASKQKETSLNECEQLKAPKQFTFSGQGFSTSNSQSLLSES